MSDQKWQFPTAKRADLAHLHDPFAGRCGVCKGWRKLAAYAEGRVCEKCYAESEDAIEDAIDSERWGVME